MRISPFPFLLVVRFLSLDICLTYHDGHIWGCMRGRICPSAHDIGYRLVFPFHINIVQLKSR